MKKELIDELFEKFEKAKISCKNADIEAPDHFADVGKMVTLGSGSQGQVNDIDLSGHFDLQRSA